MAYTDDYKKRKYAVKPYEDECRTVYARESALISQTLGGNLIFIEHVGGTAVPGLCGAGAVDVVATVRDVAATDGCELALKAIGYHSLGAVVADNARLYKKYVLHDSGEEERIVNLHVFPYDHPIMSGMLDVRDYLLAHPDEAQKYHAFKEKLFAKHPRDYAAYRDGKDAYLAKLSKKASKWKGREVKQEPGMV